MGIRLEDNTHLFELGNLAIHYFLRQPVLGDTVAKHAAEVRHGFKYGNCVSFLSQIIGY